MSKTTPLSPESLLSRIEFLKKWQLEQQQRLLQQQSQQTKFLSNEHKRMYTALGIQQKQTEENTAHEIDKRHSPCRYNLQFSNDHNNSSLEYTNENIEDNLHCSLELKNQKYLEEIPIKSPMKDFTALLEEKLKENNIPVIIEHVKPRQKFLKKGAGLSRFRMTVQDLAHKKPRPILPSKKDKRRVPRKQESVKVPKPKNEPCKTQSTQYNTNNNNILKRHSDTQTSKTDITKSFLKNDDVEPLVLNSKNLSVSTKTSNKNNLINNKPVSPNVTYPDQRAKWTTSEEESDSSKSNKTVSPKVKFSDHRTTKKRIPEEKSVDYQSLLAELIEVRQRNPTLFDSPMINQSSDNDQQIFERELNDELKLFEVLEQKACNSSFCSTSSLVTRFMDRPFGSTPKKQLNFNSLINGIPEEVLEMQPCNSSPKRTVRFSDQALQYDSSVQEGTEEQIAVSTDERDSDSSSYSYSSVNSDDISDTNDVPIKFKNSKPIITENKKSLVLFKNVAINTDQPIINSELLRTRLKQLENELDIFRSENAKINELKSQLETDTCNFEKRRRQFEKEVEEQKKQMKIQLDEERSKLAKDRSVYDRYAREIKEGKSVRQKEREELNALRSKFTIIEEEFKLKETKWGATQARIRSQLRNVEKENVTLRTENNELRTKNAKLEVANKQLLSRKPSDTKVLHEINKSLTKLAQETKEKTETTEKRKSNEKIKIENRQRTRSQSSNRNSTPPETRAESTEENKENFSNSLNTTNMSKCSTDRSFEQVEKEYDKLFGISCLYKNVDKEKLSSEGASCSDLSGKREETVLDDGTVRITYPNGNLRTISSDGQVIVMQYHNGDVKETCKETGTTRYLYSDSKTWHTTYPDGMELLEFSNGQIEKRFSNGASEIIFPNGCHRCSSPGGTEEVLFPDGTLLRTLVPTGERILTLPNGQREVHTRDHKRREYPDGTVKLLYPDGVQETRYANGRIRLKDKQGNLIMDTDSV